MTVHQLVAEPTANLPYFLAQQRHQIGLAQPDQAVPQLFRPLELSPTLLVPNRVGVSPMCMYNADVHGCATPFHLVHYGAMALRGPGLTIIEASAVVPEGRNCPNDMGMWSDSQAHALAPTVEFVHGVRGVIGIQLAHTGRKGLTPAPFMAPLGTPLDVDSGGWPQDLTSALALAFDERLPTPTAASLEEIGRVVLLFGEAAKRAVEIAKVDFVEIHAAHGYWLNSFLLNTSNKRTDHYGGSFENRVRVLLETVDAVKGAAPETPVFVRISASENVDGVDGAWTVDDSARLAPMLVAHGVRVIDILSGGISSKQNRRGTLSGFHAPLAKAVKDAIGSTALVACVGAVDSAELAEELVSNGTCDMVLVGRGFLKNPGLVWAWADALQTRLYQLEPYSWGHRLKW